MSAAGRASMRVVTRAKVNLHLEVLRRRPDGYHEIETIYQSVDLSDTLEVTFTDDGEVRVTCTDPDVPTDETNLCARAVRAIERATGRRVGARIHIDKRIPTGAGLGGGSANAAGVLLAAARALDLGMTPRDLEPLAAGLGSDVPFMLHGGTMLGRGRGEVLTPLEPVTRGAFLIVKPPVSISTAWVYGRFNSRLTRHRRRLTLDAVNSVLARFPAGNPSFRNALEDVVCPSIPAVANVLDDLLDERPGFASMTGSGSAVYAVFTSRRRAETTAERFSVRGCFTSVVDPAKRAVDIG